MGDVSGTSVPSLQLAANDDVTANRDALPGNDGVDRMTLLA